MTINYPDSFSLSLLQWRGSLYKAIWRDILLFYVLYFIVFAVNYTLFVNGPSKEDVEAALRDKRVLQSDVREMSKLIDWFDRGTGYIPLTFLLGFFVAGVVARWWEQFNWISWPDKLMKAVILCLPGAEHRAVRRTIARWANLQVCAACFVIVKHRRLAGGSGVALHLGAHEEALPDREALRRCWPHD